MDLAEKVRQDSKKGIIARHRPRPITWKERIRRIAIFPIIEPTECCICKTAFPCPTVYKVLQEIAD